MWRPGQGDESRFGSQPVAALRLKLLSLRGGGDPGVDLFLLRVVFADAARAPVTFVPTVDMDKVWRLGGGVLVAGTRSRGLYLSSTRCVSRSSLLGLGHAGGRGTVAGGTTAF